MTEQLTTVAETQEIQRNPAEAMEAKLGDLMPKFEAAIAGRAASGEFETSLLALWKSTPKLQECSLRSFLGAAMEAAKLGMIPGSTLGHCYIIPRKKQAQFQLGYRGVVNLLYRSGRVGSVWGGVAREGDVFEFEDGMDPKLRHVRKAPLSASRTHAWACIRIMSEYGPSTIVRVMTEEQLLAVKRSYVQFGGGPWDDKVNGQPDPQAGDAMRVKTVLVRLAKMAPLSTTDLRACLIDEQAEAGMDQPDVHEVIDAEASEVPAPALEEQRPIDGKELVEQAIARLKLSEDAVDRVLVASIGGASLDGIPLDVAQDLVLDLQAAADSASE